MTKDINEDFINQAERSSHNFFDNPPMLQPQEIPATVPVKRADLIDMLANNQAVPVRLVKEYVGEAAHIRLEALKLATEVALKINHFEHQYKNVEALLQDVDIVHAIASRNFKYLIGED